MAGQLHSTAAFFNKTWENRFSAAQAPAEAQTVLGKIIAGTKEGRKKKLEQDIRAKLLDQMAELTARRNGSTDKDFNQNIAPVMRGLGKLIAQKDQDKFFKQLKDFDDSISMLHSKDADTAKAIRAHVGLADEEGNVLEEIAEQEKESIGDTNLAKDLKGTLTNLLGPLGPFVHTARTLKKEYGGSVGKLWDKFKAIVESREDAANKQADATDERQHRFTKFMRLVKNGFAKIKIKDFFAKITPKASTLASIGKSLLSKKALGAAIGAAGLLRMYQHHKQHTAQATSAAASQAGHVTTATTATPVGTMPTDGGEADENGTPATQAPKQQSPGGGQDSKSMIEDARDKITDCMSDFGDWFKDKWKGVEDFFTSNPLVITGLTDIKATKDYLFAKTDKLFKAVPDMLKSVFRSIYEMLPGPIQKGVDWALKVGGESLSFFKKILGDEAMAEIDSTQPAGGPASAPTASATPTGPAAAAPVAAGDAAAGGAPGDSKFPGLKITQNADVADLQPAAKSPLLAMAQDYLSQTGKTLQINTAFRTSKEQVALYSDGKHNAAKPGTSMHEYGYAIDMHAADANKLDQMGLLQKYGFVRPVRGEPWHLEPASIQAMKATIRGGAPGAGGPSYGGTKTSQAYAAQPVAAGTDHGGGRSIGGAPDVSGMQAKHEPAKAPGMASASPMSPDTTQASLNPGEAVMQDPDSNYQRAASYNRRPQKTVATEEDTPPDKQLTGASKTSLDAISFYIGDFPFLALNMGMTEA